MNMSQAVGHEAESLQFCATRTNKLRIAIVNDAVSGRNGVGTYYADLVQHLQPFVQNIQCIGPSMEQDNELEWFSISMPGDRTQRMSWPRYRWLCKLLDAQKPNVVIVPSLGAFAFYALKYSRSRDIPVAVVNHTNFQDLASLYCPRLLAKPASWALNRINCWLIRQATAVAAMNSDSLTSARDAGVEQVRVMGTPLPPEFLSTNTRPIAENIRNAIFVGRLAMEKNIPLYVAAARELPNMRFTIIGDGPLRPMVEAASRELANLRYMGWLDRTTVMDEIDRSEVLVLPSVVETFGTVALEALARRRYVLASRECGIAKWPSLSVGLFTIGTHESVASGLNAIASMRPADRNRHAQPSWGAVRRFNQNTIRVWTSFLVDVAAKNAHFGIDDQTWGAA
jgi:glycosyltransferase involved in cell wall biosynthesis